MSSAAETQDAAAQNVPSKSIPILSLPLSKYNELCKVLNQNNNWEKLAETGMKYDKYTIDNLFKVKNPACDLLQGWSAYNHNTNELFILLFRIQHFQAMKILMDFVDDKYHYLWKEGKGNLGNGIRPCGPNVREAEANIHDETPKILNKNEPNTRRSDGPSNSNNLAVTTPPLESNILSFSKSKGICDNFIAFLKEKSLENINYEELTYATDHWNTNRIIGQGGFGKVFEGTWHTARVAIKRIEKKKGHELENAYMEELQQSFREITVLQSYRHPNILDIFGFSISNNSPPCLVYGFMANGSLQDRLQKNDKEPLDWKRRHNIAKEVAGGLQFLHNSRTKPLIHGDIKSANILLDEKFNVKIGDFGMAREIMNTVVKVTRLQGTAPYLPKEYLTNAILSIKVDIYSYGIVMYELATGLRSANNSRKKDLVLLKDYIQYNINRLDTLIDKKAGSDNNFIYKILIQVGNLCSSDDPKSRPNMLAIFNALDKINMTEDKK